MRIYTDISHFVSPAHVHRPTRSPSLSSAPVFPCVHVRLTDQSVAGAGAEESLDEDGNLEGVQTSPNKVGKWAETT